MRMTARCLLLALAIGLAGCAAAPDKPMAPYTVYLVRHAEKAPGEDPGLTPQGMERAEWLATQARRRDVAAVWSSPYRRTRETAGPIAEAINAPVREYDPRALEALASELESAAVDAAVIGHSNTTPQLAALLCDCEVDPMPETEYDRVLIVRIDGAERRLSTVRMPAALND